MAKEKLRTQATSSKKGSFHLEFLNPTQKLAWAAFDQHDVLFLLGAAGTGKSHLATAFAVNEILSKNKKKIILTRPIVEAGESLGFLPGTFEEKVNPYMLPIYDCIDKLVGFNTQQRDTLNHSIDVRPLAYMRGATFDNAICIFDEAQNATKMQLKLFLTRLGTNSKIIVTGDPMQSDLKGDIALVDVVRRLEGVPGIGVIQFNNNSIVRHPLVAAMLEKLEP